MEEEGAVSVQLGASGRSECAWKILPHHARARICSTYMCICAVSLTRKKRN